EGKIPTQWLSRKAESHSKTQESVLFLAEQCPFRKSSVSSPLGSCTYVLPFASGLRTKSRSPYWAIFRDYKHRTNCRIQTRGIAVLFGKCSGNCRLQPRIPDAWLSG